MTRDTYNPTCECGHRHSDHAESLNINYTAGRCKKCECKHFVIASDYSNQKPKK